MLEIDGSFGEGGGQILRTALFLSLITKTPFKIKNIRKTRKKPGLKRQHLSILEALGKITRSRAVGDSLGSTELLFYPGEIVGGNLEIDIKTAGSISLFLQTILPVVAFAKGPSKITIIGGTDVPGGMTIDYMRYVYLEFFRRFTRRVYIEVKRRGYYPAGGGIVEVGVEPGFKNLEEAKEKVESYQLGSRGTFKRMKIISVASGKLKRRKVAERQVSGVLSAIGSLEKPEIEIRYEDSLTPGTSVLILAEFTKTVLGADNIGKLGVPAEKIGKMAAEEFLKDLNSGATVDIHMQDNLIPFLGIAGGEFRVSTLTKHTETNIWVTEKFLPVKFSVRGSLVRAHV